MNKLSEPARKVVTLIARVGAQSGDTDDLRLQKALLVGGSFMFIAAGALWGLIYIAFGELLAGLIPLGYMIVSLFSIILFAVTRRYRFFRFSQLLLILLLPFLLMLALGGFVNSSAVILWSFLSPLGALLFDEPRHAPFWFGGFLLTVIVSGFLEPHLRMANNLPHSLIIFFFVMNVGIVSVISFTLLYSFVRQKNATLNLLQLEQKKSESLLLNILPKEIAAILKNESRIIADYYESASVLFADMVNFTPMSTEMSPAAMVELLNEIFSHFDTLVEKYDLEKFKTIGDSYMVAAGVPLPRSDHAQVLSRLALDIRAYIQSRTFNASRPVNFRIGINSGPVLAGVIGRKKFAYDLWGDVVNTASRMESHGVSGTIQITRATYELIKDEFECEPRGTITVKGKGDMEVWHIVKEKTSLSKDGGGRND